MNDTNEKIKLSRVMTAIVFGLIAVFFIMAMTASPAAYVPQTRIASETTTEDIFTPADTTEAYSIAESTPERTTEYIDLYELPVEALSTYDREAVIEFLAVTVSNDSEIEPVTESEPRYFLSDEEKHMLCYVADSEDHSSVESRQAVMQTVMNRVESDKFPDTISDVLYQHKQFAVMKRYDSNYAPSDEALEALERLLYEDDVFDGEVALFFANKRVEPRKIAKGLYLVKSVGESKFWGQE